MTAVGENIRKARLRRSYSSQTVAQRAGITRKTLYRVERGDPAVALGIYARVLQTLRLENDLGSIAADDALGRKLQDANLEPKLRASKRSAAAAVRPDAKNSTNAGKESKDLP